MEATIRLPISSRTRNASSSLWLKVSAQTIRAVRVSASSTVTVRRFAVAPHGSADDVVDVEHPAGLFRADVPLVQREHRPLRDDEQAAQLGEPGDDVVGERVGGPAAGAGGGGAVDERHDRDGGAARRTAMIDRGRRLRQRRERRPATPGGPAACALADRQALRIGAVVEAFGFEQPGGRRQMLLAFADAAVPGKRGQKDLVDMRIEGRELEPLLQILERLVIGSALGEMLQQGGVAAAESSALRGEPAVEDRAAVDLEALQEIAVEQRGTALAAAPARASRCPRSAARAISIASTKQSARSSQMVSPRVWTRWRPRSSTMLRILLRHQRSSPRGSLGTSHSSSQSWLRDTGARRKRQIGEERAHLAGCRQRQRGAVAGRSSGARAGGRGSRASPPGRPEPIEFHGNSHAGYHVRSHVWPLRSRSTVTARRWSRTSNRPPSADARRNIAGRRGGDDMDTSTATP